MLDLYSSQWYCSKMNITIPIEFRTRFAEFSIRVSEYYTFSKSFGGNAANIIREKETDTKKVIRPISVGIYQDYMHQFCTNAHGKGMNQRLHGALFLSSVILAIMACQ